MQNTTTEFSFILKPSNFGVGVFTTHNIKTGTFLKLFGDGDEVTDRSVVRKKNDVPELYQQYCMDRGETLICPKNFNCMEVGWYLNHSKNPNAGHKNYNYYASHDILAGEEITIDYNQLEEPKEAKENYY